MVEPAIEPEEYRRVEDGARIAAQDALQDDELPDFGRPRRCEHGEAVDGDCNPQQSPRPLRVATEEADDRALQREQAEINDEVIPDSGSRSERTGKMYINASCTVPIADREAMLSFCQRSCPSR